MGRERVVHGKESFAERLRGLHNKDLRDVMERGTDTAQDESLASR